MANFRCWKGADVHLHLRFAMSSPPGMPNADVCMQIFTNYVSSRLSNFAFFLIHLKHHLKGQRRSIVATILEPF